MQDAESKSATASQWELSSIRRDIYLGPFNQNRIRGKVAPFLRPKLVAFLSASEGSSGCSFDLEIGAAFALGVCQAARDKGKGASSDAFRWIFLSVHFPGCDRRVCLGINRCLPRKFKCTGHEPCAHCQPKRIQGNWQYAIQADAATQRS